MPGAWLVFKSTGLWAYHKQIMKGGKVRAFEHSTHPADSAFTLARQSVGRPTGHHTGERTGEKIARGTP